MNSNKYFAPSILALSLAASVGIYLVAVDMDKLSSRAPNQRAGSSYSQAMNQERSTAPREQPGERAPNIGTRSSAPLHVQAPSSGARTVEIGISSSTAGNYALPLIEAKAGEILTLILRNNTPPEMHKEHNLVLTEKSKVGPVAEEALRAGPQKGYIPDSADVLAFIPLVPAGASASVTIQAPDRPGMYSYFCTFPGHAAGEVGHFRVKG